jgi:organic hydroperoxide reductase OsmC/OhrA
MHDFPHQYSVIASGDAEHDIALEADRLPILRSAPPAEFGGPGDRWSPETLLVAAVADCFVLTFRAVAGALRLSWISLTCDVSGTLDRVERVTQFTQFEVRARLSVPAGTDEDQARRALDRAERGCLITHSLKAAVRFHAEVAVAPKTTDVRPNEYATTRG